jgi:hypothetical protein
MANLQSANTHTHTQSHLVVLDPLDNLGTALLAVEHLIMLITQALLRL